MGLLGLDSCLFGRLSPVSIREGPYPSRTGFKSENREQENWSEDLSMSMVTNKVVKVSLCYNR